MKQTRVMIPFVLVVGMVVGWFGHQCLNAQQIPVTRTVLLRTDLAGWRAKKRSSS
jgi:hypothetical protein